jgi:hypothetical protein
LSRRRGGGTVKVLSVPEREERNKPAIELIVADSVGPMALEHTTVEPFERHIEASSFLSRVFPDPDHVFEVPGLDPACQYQLNVAALELRGNVKDPAVLRAQIEGWITRTAPTLVADPLRPARRHADSGDELPVTVGLSRDDTPLGSPYAGKVYLAFTAPQDVERLRVDRLERALRQKCPKLARARLPGGVTVLVIETGDWSVTNSHLVLSALQEATTRVSDPLPDVIVFIVTVGKSHAWVLYQDGAWHDDGFVELDLGDDA